MNKDEYEVFNLLQKAGALRAVQIHQTLHMGFHRLYPALHQLKKDGYIQGTKESGQLFYELTGLQPPSP